MFIDFRERGRRERARETNIGLLPPICTLTGDGRTCNPLMSGPRPFVTIFNVSPYLFHVIYLCYTIVEHQDILPLNTLVCISIKYDLFPIHIHVFCPVLKVTLQLVCLPQEPNRVHIVHFDYSEA